MLAKQRRNRMTNTHLEIARLRAELERQAALLHECQHLLKESQAIAGLGTYVLDIPTGTWTSSPVLDNIFGIDDDYVRSVEGWTAIVHPEWRDAMARYFTDEVVAKGSRFDKEYKIVRCSDGEERWVHGLGELEKNAAGKPVTMIGTIMDITKRKQADLALIESEERFRNVFEHAAVGKSITSPDGTVRVNQGFCDMIGYTKEELTNLKWQQLTHPDDVERDQKILNSLISGECDSARWQKRYIHKNGTVVWVDVATVLQRDNATTPSYFITTVLDITERKIAEEASKQVDEKLRNSEAFLNRMIEQSPLPTWIADDQGTLVRLNQACCELLKLSEDEVVGRYNIFHDNIVNDQGFMPLVRAVFERGETARFEIHYDSAKVRGLKLERTAAVILDVTIFPIRDTRGRITNAVIQHNDITARKLAEEALEASERRLSTIYDTVGDVVFHLAVEPEGKYRFVSVNRAFCRVTGISEEKVVGMLVNEVIPEPSLSMVLGKYKKAIEENCIVRWEETSIYPTGRLIGDVGIAPVVDDKGRCTHLVGSVHDITERKRIEEQLSASEVRYRSLFEAARDGIVILDADTGVVVDVNPFLVELLGYPRDVLLGKKIWELGFFKDTAANKVHLTELRRNEFIQYEDMPLETANGHLINVEFVSHVYQVDRHKVIQCNIRDITARKLVEEKTLLQLDELRRWQEVTLGREDRVRQLKSEVNQLLVQHGETVRYPSLESASDKQEMAKG
jgi:PAS domain S-box-containing protein